MCTVYACVRAVKEKVKRIKKSYGRARARLPRPMENIKFIYICAADIAATDADHMSDVSERFLFFFSSLWSSQLGIVFLVFQF